jgi:hypothetical protein|tara:strand:+ start:582 stop:1067 length:486 start_codon:yes stop_codon:yes gene_type:complete
MNSKNYNKNNRKFIQGLRSFKDILPSKVKNLINKKGQIYSETLDNWRCFVGNDLFDISFPKSFKNENKLGSSCLTVMVKRGNEVNFEYSKSLIIEKINSFFGYEAVQNIKLVSFEEKNKEFEEKQSADDVTKNKYKKQISGIKNEKIKDSLIKFSKVYKKK